MTHHASDMGFTRLDIRGKVPINKRVAQTVRTIDKGEHHGDERRQGSDQRR